MRGSRNSIELAQELRRMIDGGEWSLNGRLPPERVLAGRFSVARNTLRRALDMLESTGYLTRHVGRGTFIMPQKREPAKGIAFRMSEASPRDILETRLIMEPQAAGLAAMRATRTDLEIIVNALDQSLAAKDITEFEHWDAQLHLAIFVAAKNEVLIDYCRAISDARNQPQWFKLKKRSLTADRRRRYNEQHRAIVVALSERNAKAAIETMHQHLSTVEASILGVA
jgi:DNA-binding FadR family transcriptional regulator